MDRLKGEMIMKNLIACKSCGKEISKEAKMCPHCGRNYKKSKIGSFIFLGVIVGIIFLFRYHIYDLIFSSEIIETLGITETFSIEKYLGLCQEYDYYYLKDNHDFYKGKDTYFIGKISEINYNNNSLKIVKNVSAFPSQLIYVEYKPFFNDYKSFEKNDIVKVYGECNGIYKHDVLFGITRDIPYIIGRYIVYEN